MEMRRQTGWADEQLEGWKIMLERNVSWRDMGTVLRRYSETIAHLPPMLLL